jgi:hypothetical protein
MIRINVLMKKNILIRNIKIKKGDKRRNKNKFFKKIFYSKQDNSSSDEDGDSDSDS